MTKELRYYKAETVKKKKGGLSLAGATVAAADSDPRRPHLIEVFIGGSATTEARVFLLFTDTADDRTLLVEALRQCAEGVDAAKLQALWRAHAEKGTGEPSVPLPTASVAISDSVTS